MWEVVLALCDKMFEDETLTSNLLMEGLNHVDSLQPK